MTGQEIRFLILKNSGSYNVTLKAVVDGVLRDSGNKIGTGDTTWLDLTPLGLVQGDNVQVYCDVEAGNDMSGAEVFSYDAASLHHAGYECSGTPEDDSLSFIGWG